MPYHVQSRHVIAGLFYGSYAPPHMPLARPCPFETLPEGSSLTARGQGFLPWWFPSCLICVRFWPLVHFSAPFLLALRVSGPVFLDFTGSVPPHLATCVHVVTLFGPPTPHLLGGGFLSFPFSLARDNFAAVGTAGSQMTSSLQSLGSSRNPCLVYLLHGLSPLSSAHSSNLRARRGGGFFPPLCWSSRRPT